MGKKKKDKRQRIPLSKYTRGGMISTGIAMLSLIVFAVAVGISIYEKGKAGAIVGYLAFATIALSVIGYVVGINSFKEETRFLKFSWIGTILNLFIWVMMFMMFLVYR